jgi:hypothetical protein
MKAAAKTRSRVTKDLAWMRRLRRRYLQKISWWIEEDRDRIDAVCQRFRDRGLYAKTTDESSLRHGVITTLAALAGADTPTRKRSWLLKTGWAAYWGWMNSATRRASRRHRAAATA